MQGEGRQGGMGLMPFPHAFPGGEARPAAASATRVEERPDSGAPRATTYRRVTRFCH